MWEMPRAKPPARAKPTLGCLGVFVLAVFAEDSADETEETRAFSSSQWRSSLGMLGSDIFLACERGAGFSLGARWVCVRWIDRGMLVL
jgi:hypothetical protein